MQATSYLLSASAMMGFNKGLDVLLPDGKEWEYILSTFNGPKPLQSSPSFIRSNEECYLTSSESASSLHNEDTRTSEPMDAEETSLDFPSPSREDSEFDVPLENGACDEKEDDADIIAWAEAVARAQAEMPPKSPEIIIPIKKLGRPRKYPLEAAKPRKLVDTHEGDWTQPSETDSSSTEVPIQPKKRPGRPRKNPLEVKDRPIKKAKAQKELYDRMVSAAAQPVTLPSRPNQHLSMWSKYDSQKANSKDGESQASEPVLAADVTLGEPESPASNPLPSEKPKPKAAIFLPQLPRPQTSNSLRTMLKNRRNGFQKAGRPLHNEVPVKPKEEPKCELLPSTTEDQGIKLIIRLPKKV